MPVIIQSKERYQGSVTPQALNSETTVIEITGASDDYIVEGYISLSALQSGDTLIVKEYIAVDGVNYFTFLTMPYNGPVSDPVIRFHAKTLLYNMKYKVTITQTAGTIRSFPYGFIIEVLGTV
ncbi:MAG: hypothetical protein NDF52_05710 [archaeon YNP-WB-062]|nr:hypothetical protein [Candidatus Culexarchaeum yellowstonense]